MILIKGEIMITKIKKNRIKICIAIPLVLGFIFQTVYLNYSKKIRDEYIKSELENRYYPESKVKISLNTFKDYFSKEETSFLYCSKRRNDFRIIMLFPLPH